MLDGGNSILSIDTGSVKMYKCDKLKHEKAKLGFYVSGHPMVEYRDIAPAINVSPSSDLSNSQDRTNFCLCGVMGVMVKKFAKTDNRPWASRSSR
jgi:DNA polymerase-3 subunit alpha